MYPKMFSTVVSRTPVGSFSSTPISVLVSLSATARSVPVQPTAPQHVDVGQEDRDDEQDHLDQGEDAHQVERDRPRVEEDDLDVEDDEEHRRDVVLHRE